MLVASLAAPLAGCGASSADLLTVAATVASAVLVQQAGRAGSTGAPTGSGLPPITLPGSGTATTTPTTTLPTSGSAAASGPADAQLAKALAAANVARTAAGARPLTWSQPLANVALRHSQDMADHDYFDHKNPSGQSPFDRMKLAGITYGSAAENIAQNYSDSGDEVIQQWLNSPGHRANMLSTAFAKMGLGVVTAADGAKYWTQTFTD
jgi:uncharacterized protein YkwD